MKRLVMCIFSMLFCCIIYVFSQDTTKNDTIKIAKTHVIELYDGTMYVGTIVSRNATNILLETNTKTRIDIPITQILRISAIVPESTWPNQFPHRYFFSQSAFNLKKNDADLKISSCYSLNPILPFTFLTTFNHGFTDFLSIEGGVELISLFNSNHPLFFINPKVGFKVGGKWHLGAGVYYVNMGEECDSAVIGLGYGLITYGTPEHNLTLAGGTGVSYGKFVEKPTFTLSGITKVSKRLYLVTENWLIPVRDKSVTTLIDPITFDETNSYSYKYVYNLYISYGMRFVMNKYAVDVGFINNKDIFDVTVIGSPFMDFSIKF